MDTLLYAWLPALVAAAAALSVMLCVGLIVRRKWKLLNADHQLFLDEIARTQAQMLEFRLANARMRSLLPNGVSPENPAPHDSPSGFAAPEDERLPTPMSRFPQLRTLDALPPVIANEKTSLPALMVHLQRFAAARYGIYAPRSLFGGYLATLACGNFVIAHDSNTLKALPFLDAMAKALGNPMDLFAVSSNWTTPALLIGQAHALHKRYEERDFLLCVYQARRNAHACFATLENFFAANPEDYFSPMLTQYEKHPTDIACGGLRLADGSWPNDPLLLENGTLPLPNNLWVFGTVSVATPPMSARVQTAAVCFSLPQSETRPFLVPWTEPMHVSAAHLRDLFARADDIYDIPEKIAAAFDAMERYAAEHLCLSLGVNARVNLRRFMSTALACGLGSREAFDAYLYHSGLRAIQAADADTLHYGLPLFIAFLHKQCNASSLPTTMAMLGRCSQKEI
ncbi:MAG: hypothetical protein LBB67_01565 [Oscillospiraceae bacterium]|nr:hypothetical protein [Oscillospiraceae bacterium]